jgi:hypothetical protein
VIANLTEEGELAMKINIQRDHVELEYQPL